MNACAKCLLVLFAFAVVGCPSSSPGSFTGRGECNIKTYTFDRDAGEPLPPPDSFGGTDAVLCGGSVEGRKALPLIDVSSPCVCDFPDTVDGRLVDAAAQRAELNLRGEIVKGCKLDVSTEAFHYTDAVGCHQFAYVHGFLQRSVTGIGGNGHDGDEDPHICPIEQGVHNGRPDFPFADRSLDLRSRFYFDTRDPNYSFLKTEWQWCRWFGGPVTVPADPNHVPPLPEVHHAEFRPQAGELVSLLGDWILESSWTEIHEVHAGATVRPVPGVPDVWHVLASAKLTKDTAVEDALSFPVRIPRSSQSLNTKLECTPLKPDGCLNPALLDPEVEAVPDLGICKITIRKKNENNDDGLTDRDCGVSMRNDDNGPDLKCPCYGAAGTPERAEDADMLCSARGFTDFTAFNRCTFSGLEKAPHTDSATDVGVKSQIAYAGVIQAEWKDPLDLWMCNCACDDPSAPGASIVARVQGCAQPGYRRDVDLDIRAACNEVCGGTICGSDPECRIGACRPLAQGRLDSWLVARNVCVPPPPDVRVSHTGDYRVDLDPLASTVELGTLDPSTLDFSPVGSTLAVGRLWMNDNKKSTSDRRLELASLNVTLKDFALPVRLLGFDVDSVPVEDASGTSDLRASAFLGPRDLGDGSTLQDGQFLLPPGQLRLHAVARVDGEGGKATSLNEGPLTGTFDLGARQFSLDGIGQLPEGRALRMHLQGAIANLPPLANPGPDRFEECTSPGGTPVTLDATASSDPDGNAIAHFQWFSGDQGLGNTPIVQAVAKLGANAFDLHVYDQDLASGAQRLSLTVRDTVAPSLEVSVQPVCLWPPNHAFALFKLGRELAYTTADVCDSAPTVRIISVTSDEPTLAEGSGSTEVDVRFGATTACVRSERTGPGEGRSYTVLFEAQDAAGNSTRKSVKVFVPHDKSTHPDCARAEGVAFLGPECEQ